MIFSKLVAAVLAVLLAAIQAVQLNVHTLSNDLSNVISISVIILASLAIAPTAGQWIGAHLPLHLAAAATALLGVLQALNQDTLHVGAVAHTVIAVAIVVAASMGIKPSGAGPAASWAGDPGDKAHG